MLSPRRAHLRSRGRDDGWGHAAAARLRPRTGGRSCRGRSSATRTDLVEFRLQLPNGCGHFHWLGREDRLGRGALTLQVGRHCYVDRLTNDGSNGGTTSAGSGLDATISRLVEQDLEPSVEHVHTLACVWPYFSIAGDGGQGSSGGELEQPERGDRVLQQQRRQAAAHPRVLPKFGDGCGSDACIRRKSRADSLDEQHEPPFVIVAPPRLRKSPDVDLVLRQDGVFDAPEIARLDEAREHLGRVQARDVLDEL